jgi:hypothetical protein
MARQSVELIHSGDAYLQLHAGQRNSAVLSSKSRVIHCQITGWRKRGGETNFTRVRFDPDADVVRVGYQNEITNPNRINQPTYTNTTDPTTYSADRIRLVDNFNGRSAVRHTVKLNLPTMQQRNSHVGRTGLVREDQAQLRTLLDHRRAEAAGARARPHQPG